MVESRCLQPAAGADLSLAVATLSFRWEPFAMAVPEENDHDRSPAMKAKAPQDRRTRMLGCAGMPESTPLAPEIPKLLSSGDLSFRDFVELALYPPSLGYYAGSRSPVGKEGDYVTSPTLTPAFSFGIGRLVAEFRERVGDAPPAVVDGGCGDGLLLRDVVASLPPEFVARASFHGVDRALGRVSDDAR